jgi:hypothetical protein
LAIECCDYTPGSAWKEIIAVVEAVTVPRAEASRVRHEEAINRDGQDKQDKENAE